MAMPSKPGTTAATVVDLALKGYSTQEIHAELKGQGIKTAIHYIEGVLRQHGLIGKENKLQQRVENIETMLYEVWVLVKQLTNLPEGEIQRRIQELKDRNDREFAQRVATIRAQRIDEAAAAHKEAIEASAKRRRHVVNRKASIKRRTGEERQQLDLMKRMLAELTTVPKPSFKTLMPRPPRGPRPPAATAEVSTSSPEQSAPAPPPSPEGSSELAP